MNLLKKYRPVYIAARLIRSRLPEFVAERFLSRRSLNVESLYRDETGSTYNYLRAIEGSGVRRLFENRAPITCLEAGTGLYNPLSAPLLLCGVERLMVLEPFVRGEIDWKRFHRRVRSLLQLAEKDRDFPLPKLKRTEDLQTAGNPKSISAIEVRQEFWEKTQLPDNSVDLIVSSSVLEHLREPHKVLTECFRVLKSDGWMINIVDLRDHFFRYPYEMLKYSDRFWRILTTRRGGSGYQNRLRLSHWITALERAGFESKSLPLIEDSVLLQREKGLFAKPFGDLPDCDLKVLYAALVSRRLPE